MFVADDEYIVDNVHGHDHTVQVEQRMFCTSLGPPSVRQNCSQHCRLQTHLCALAAPQIN